MFERRWTDEQLIAAVPEARSLSGVIRALGLRVAGSNFTSVKGHIARLGLDTSHFEQHGRQGPPPRTAKPLEEILTTGSTYKRGHLKRRLFDAGLKQRACELCGQTEDWHGRRMSLILDHINGVHDDNRLENLRIVCPNCNATLDTHCGRALRIVRAPKSCEVCAQEFVPKVDTQRFCSRKCVCDRFRPDTRVVHDRPPLDELRARIDAEGYQPASRELGVSDNAIRKWFKAAGEEPPRRYEKRRAA